MRNLKKIFYIIVIILIFCQTNCFSEKSILVSDSPKTLSNTDWNFATYPSADVNAFCGFINPSKYLKVSSDSYAVNNGFLDGLKNITAFFGTVDIKINFSVSKEKDSNEIIRFGEKEDSLFCTSIIIDSVGKLYYQNKNSYVDYSLINNDFTIEDGKIYQMRLIIHTGNSNASVSGERNTYDLYINNVLMRENIPFCNSSGGITFGKFEQIGEGEMNIYSVSYSDNVNGWGADNYIESMEPNERWRLSKGSEFVENTDNFSDFVIDGTKISNSCNIIGKRTFSTTQGIVMFDINFKLLSDKGFVYMSAKNGESIYNQIRINCQSGEVDFYTGSKYISSGTKINFGQENSIKFYAAPNSSKNYDAYINNKKMLSEGVQKIIQTRYLNTFEIIVSSGAGIDILSLDVARLSERNIEFEALGIFIDGAKADALYPQTEYHILYNIENHKSYDENACFVTAVYDGEKMIDVRTYNAEIASGQKEKVDIEYISPQNTNNLKIKFFIMDSLIKLRPVLDFKELK